MAEKKTLTRSVYLDGTLYAEGTVVGDKPGQLTEAQAQQITNERAWAQPETDDDVAPTGDDGGAATGAQLAREAQKTAGDKPTGRR